jgi:hypothetical protein
MISDYDRSLHHVSIQDLYKSFVGKIFFYKTSLSKISATGPFAMSLYKVSKKRCPGKMSVQDL